MNPRHIAIIMDGNGRWAKSRGLERLKGHNAGAKNVSRIMEAAQNRGVKYLTLYAFSVENWKRPKLEVQGLMRLLKKYLKDYEKDFHKNKIRLRVLGRKSDLPKELVELIEQVEDSTKNYTDYQLILALSYSGRVELVSSIQNIVEKVTKGEITASDVTEELVSANMYLPDVPDPDLIIRTSGEFRVSNFLLWQCAYSEFYITDVYWPDFDEKEFDKALESFSKRDRRFGGLKNVRGAVEGQVTGAEDKTRGVGEE